MSEPHRIAAPRPEPRANGPSPDRLARFAPGQPAAGPKRYLRILVVDDLVVNRKLLAAILGSSGHSVTEASSGRAAVETCQSAPFDLILMDLHMPAMDGVAATRMVRAHAGPNRDTAILALTADVRPEQIAVCIDAGMDGYLAKPISLVDLLAAIAQLDVREEEDEACPA